MENRNLNSRENRPQWDGDFLENKKQKTEGSLAKSALGIIGGAMLFGTVAAVSMTGVHLAASSALGLPRPQDWSAAVRETLSAADQAPQEPVREQRPPAFVDGNTGISEIVEETMPAVVAIAGTREYYDPYSWIFGGSQVGETTNAGSGIIVEENGSELLVVTNNHVVEGAKELSVTFSDGTQAPAAAKGTDSGLDLAVIAVELSDISSETRETVRAAALGDSDALKVGQGVIAIGNALGYGQSVTVGYVSALNRQVPVDPDGGTRTLLQTDAAINPGNSGGALVNMQGEVIGINSAKYSSTEVEGIGYAIPISDVREILGGLMDQKTRRVLPEERRGYLGIQGTTVDQETAFLLDMPEGVYVYGIVAGGGAEHSGLREKDIITAVDGRRVESMSGLQEILSYYEAGEEVSLTVQTLDGGQYTERQVPVTLSSPIEEEDT